MSDIAAGDVIKFTDNGWTSAGAFRANEGTVTWTAPAGGVLAGTVVTITSVTPTGTPASASVGTVSEFNDLNPSTAGDQIFAYTGPDSSPTFLFGLNNEGEGLGELYWDPTGGDASDRDLLAQVNGVAQMGTGFFVLV